MKSNVAKKTKTATLATLALACAREAYEQNFPSRRGTYIIEDKPDAYVCVYHNNPCQGDDARRELGALIEQLAQHGVDVAAVGSWPRSGESADYTKSILFKVPPGTDDEAAHDLVRVILAGTLAAAHDEAKRAQAPTRLRVVE